MSAPKLADALATAHVVHDREVLEAAIERIAGDIRDAYADGEAPLFLTVMNGGLPFAAQLAFALGERGLDLEFDYLHATRYRGQTSGSGLAWLHRPATPMRGRKVLLACDGCAKEIPATVNFISDQPEYTPPVIYSNETREKLVFMVEARPSVENAPSLRPGQPLTVTLQ